MLRIRWCLVSGAAPAALLSVEDAGPGLDRGDAERCFEAFYTTKPRGLGMGLAISRTIVRAHGYGDRRQPSVRREPPRRLLHGRRERGFGLPAAPRTGCSHPGASFFAMVASETPA